MHCLKYFEGKLIKKVEHNGTFITKIDMEKNLIPGI